MGHRLIGAAVCALLSIIAVFCCAGPAQAIRRDEIPPELRARLPEFVLTIIDPRALAAIGVADLEEFADAYEAGELRFINDCRIEGRGGPLSDEQAMGILQCMPGAPYIEKRFLRQVRFAYGRGIFSQLSWEVHRNADNSVDIHLWYDSRDPSFISPELSWGQDSGLQLGAAYQDLYYGQENKQLRYGAQLYSEDLQEPRLFASWDDNTIDGGSASLSLAASVGNNWRTRLSGKEGATRIRERVARVDAALSRGSGLKLLCRRGSEVLRAGVYHQDSALLAGDPAGAPRAELEPDGTAAYIGVGWASGRRDQTFTPQSGWSYRVDLRQHFGDYPFREASVDLRRYSPAANVLGHEQLEHMDFGERYKAHWALPTASFAWQLQAALQDGDVPLSEELIPGGSRSARSHSYSRYSGTKLLGARAEYRFHLDRGGSNEAFVYVDNAWIGERLDKLESLNGYGLGGLFTLPLYGGVKFGAYYGRAFNNEDTNYGVAFGYQF
ncbi:hypothetical protein IT575_07745 [bacterium]|nr:hypothetical protein [bacterium]